MHPRRGARVNPRPARRPTQMAATMIFSPVPIIGFPPRWGIEDSMERVSESRRGAFAVRASAGGSSDGTRPDGGRRIGSARRPRVAMLQGARATT